jgi:uncharacterized protein YukE
VGPLQLMTTLMANADAGIVCSAIVYAPKLLKNSAHALQYFLANPTNTLLDYRQTIAQVASTEASLAPTNEGQAQAPSGAWYTKWSHNADIDCKTLHMLLNEGYATITYGSTFKTDTEQGQGGDTEEYFIHTLNSESQWVQRWVVHIHRGYGQNKQSAPSASHIKRYEQRKLKDAKRISIDTSMAKRCRETNTD